MSFFTLPANVATACLHRLPAGTQIWRNHLGDIPPLAFFKGVGDKSRFTPVRKDTGGFVPTLSAATSFEAAAFEAIFRDPIGPYSSFPVQWLKARCISRISLVRPLFLVPFFPRDLADWDLDEDTVFTPHQDTYRLCRALAFSAWRDNPDADGIVWTARRDRSSKAMILFGDRATPTDLALEETRVAAEDPNLVDELARAASRAGILISL